MTTVGVIKRDTRSFNYGSHYDRNPTVSTVTEFGIYKADLEALNPHTERSEAQTLSKPAVWAWVSMPQNS